MIKITSISISVFVQLTQTYCVLADETVIVAHVKAHTVIDNGTLFGIFWINWILRVVFIAQVLHYCNAFTQ